MLKFHYLGLAVALILATGCTASEKQIASDAASTADVTPAVLQLAQRDKGWVIKEKFDSGTDLQGWFVQTTGGVQTAFTDSKGHLFLGQIISPTGEVLNQKYSELLLKKVDIAAELKSAHLIQVGGKPGAPADVVVFYEPYCPFCSKIFAALKPYMDDGKVIHFLPVAFIDDGRRGRPSSQAVAHALFEASEPGALLTQHEKSHLTALASVQPSALTLQKLQTNQTIMSTLGISGTPALLIKNPDGSYTRHLNMVTASDLPVLLNMPRQDSNDPRLVQFGAQPDVYPVN